MTVDRDSSRKSSLVFDADGTSKPWTKAAICFTALTSSVAAGACAVAHQGVLTFTFVFLMILTVTTATWLIARDLRAAELELKRRFPAYDPDWKRRYACGDDAGRAA